MTTIRFREILAFKYIPNTLLTKVGIFDVFDNMLRQCGHKKFVSMQDDTYVDLITEFYTTLYVNANNS